MSKATPREISQISASEAVNAAPQANTGKAPFVASGSENFGFFPQQIVDNLVHVVIDLGAEHWALRRRMFILEKTLEAHGSLSKNAVELVEPSAEDLAAWEEERNIFIKRAFGALARSGPSKAD